MFAIFLKDQKKKKEFIFCKNAKELVLPSPLLNDYFSE